MVIPFKPLGIIKEMLEGIGLEITYVYDDLLFIDHNAFLLRMGESGEDIQLYFNTESSVEKRDDIANLLTECGRQYRFAVKRRGTYSILESAGKEEFQLHLFEGRL